MQAVICPVLPTFEERPASHQNALDLFKGGWHSAMPVGSGLVAGDNETFSDARVKWVASAVGGLHGKNVLELGPFEGYSAGRLESFAANVLSIENNSVNFLKCLTLKNIFGWRSTFLFGDFIEYMENAKSKFDICWMSGVLYHMTDPLRLLHAASGISDAIFIWTQYYDAEIIKADDSLSSFFVPEKSRTIESNGSEITLNYRSYVHHKGALYAGGSDQFSYWLTKDDILKALANLGFTKITMGADAPNFANGPAAYFLAEKSMETAIPPGPTIVKSAR